MAQIQDYILDVTPENSDFVLGAGSDNSTKRFTLEDLKTFFQSGLTSGASVNNYPTALNLDETTAIFTLSRNGLTDLTVNFGTAALSASSDFALSTHTHTAADILSSNDITADYLNVADNGTAGQYLISDGDGSFSWTDGVTSDTNYYLTAIAKNGNNLEFTVSGAPTETVSITLGSAAYEASTSFASSSHSHAIGELTGVGALASLNKVGATEIKTDSVITSKIKDSQVTAAKLAISGNGTSGQVLISDGDGTFSWSTPSGNNYYLSGITKTTNTLNFAVTGAATQSYTFGDGAFLSVGTAAGTLAAGDHTHLAASITDLGAIATLDEITVDEIADGAVTPIKFNGLSNNGTSGQIIQTNGDGTFSYTSAGTFDGAFSSLTGTPTTLAGYGITDGLSSVSFSNLNNEFKTVATTVTLSSSSTTATLDFSAAAVFQVTLPSDATNTTITYSNTTIGQTKILKVAGSGGTGTVTITGTKLAGTLDQTLTTINYIQVTAIGASEYIYTISQA